MIDFAQSQQNDDLEEAFCLVSRQIDGDLADAEISRLTVLESKFPDRIAEFRGQCLDLRSALKQGHTTPVPRLLFDRSRVTSDAAVIGLRKKKGIVWGSMTAILAACLLLATLKPWQDTSSSGLPLATAQNDASPPGVATAQAAVDAVQFPSPPFSGLLTLPEPEEWTIVVVKIGEERRSAAMEQVRQVFSSHGYSFPASTSDEESAWMGFVLTSAEPRSQQIVSEMGAGIEETSIETDPQRVGESSAEELISRIRTSLASPSQSELFHGMVYLAVPNSHELVAAIGKRGLVTEPDLSLHSDKAVARSENGIEESPTETLDAPETGIVAKQPASTVTLVVLQFLPEQSGATGESSPQQI